METYGELMDEDFLLDLDAFVRSIGINKASQLSAAARNGAILGGLDGYRCQWVSGPSAGTR
jgi:hypothetical protein